MNIVEIVPDSEDKKEEQERCTCWLLERYLTWVVIFTAVFFLCMFSYEYLRLLDLNNRILETQLKDHMILQQKQHFYRREPPLWMP